MKSLSLVKNYRVLCQPTLKASNERIRIQQSMVILVREVALKVEVAVVYYSDAPIWNLADIPITDNGSEISADTDSLSNIKLRSNFLPFST